MELFTVELLEKQSEYQMPVVFITGSCDFTTPVACTQEYLDVITAPSKNLFVMEGCGHGPQFDASQEFSEIVKKSLQGME